MAASSISSSFSIISALDSSSVSMSAGVNAVLTDQLTEANRMITQYLEKTQKLTVELIEQYERNEKAEENNTKALNELTAKVNGLIEDNKLIRTELTDAKTQARTAETRATQAGTAATAARTRADQAEKALAAEKVAHLDTKEKLLQTYFEKAQKYLEEHLGHATLGYGECLWQPLTTLGKTLFGQNLDKTIAELDRLVDEAQTFCSTNKLYWDGSNFPTTGKPFFDRRKEILAALGLSTPPGGPSSVGEKSCRTCSFS